MTPAIAEGTAPTAEQMAEACEIGANVQLALSSDKVAKETARRLLAAAAALRAPTPAPTKPAPSPKPAGEQLGARRIGDLARAADAIIVLRSPGPNGRFLVDADDMKKLEDAVRPFQVLTSLKGSNALPRGKRAAAAPAPTVIDEEENDDDEGE